MWSGDPSGWFTSTCHLSALRFSLSEASDKAGRQAHTWIGRQTDGHTDKLNDNQTDRIKKRNK